MDINNLRTLWLQYDRRLSGNLELNETLLRNTNFNAFRKELQKPLLYEQVNVALTAILIPVFLVISLKFINHVEYLVVGLVFCIALIVQILLGIRKLRYFRIIDCCNNSLLTTQKQLTRLKLIILQSRKLELMLIPFFIIPGIILLMKLMHNIDVFVHTRIVLVYVLVGIAATLAGTIVINKYLYDRKISNLTTILAELKSYESEN